jgi:hypothetical protein
MFLKRPQAWLSALRRAVGRFQSLIVQSRGALLLQHLYHESSVSKQEEILFWVPGGMPLMLHLEGAIAAAMTLRGYEVHAVICDGVFTACVKREVSDQIPMSRWSEACFDCKNACSKTLSQLGIHHSFVGDHVSTQELAAARKRAEVVQWDCAHLLTHNGILIGKNVKSAVLRFLKGRERPTDAGLLQEYAFSGLVCAASARNVLEKRRPARVFMSHGAYVDWGPALSTAIALGIPLTAWMASYLRSRFYFRHVPDSVNIDFHNMSIDAWNQVKTRKLSFDEALRLDQYVIERYTKNASFDMKYFKPFLGNTKDLKARYSLNEEKPIWGILAHINWDTVSDFAPMLYDSFNEWILDTIEVVSEIAGVQWLVKVHPAEAWEGTDSGVESLIRKTFPRLPPNIALLPADETISPLDFYSLVSGAVTVYGTAGLELAMRGTPVILAGDAHYGKKGFTLDPQSRDAYRDLLRQAAGISKLSDFQVELAKKYAYCYFILRQIPVAVVSDPNSKWWSFQFDKIQTLLPGNDLAIDFICDRIIDGKDFIMDPPLEAATREQTT